ncbi:MAG: type IX secretion system membrane protein PorP/SprF, partial [Chitinophagales bacterium]|nr:type IX secretion system membrane protein PorP/SprF [Chitinophagales bacterium]
MKNIFLVSFLSCFSLFLKAQDLKFSQFYNSPLNLNPALTGKIPGIARVVVNYRNQDNPVVAASAYSTISASADFGLLRDVMNDNVLG